MPPAKDRTRTRSGFGTVILALATGLLGSGCAREWSIRRTSKGEPPLLGAVDPSGTYPHGEVLADNGPKSTPSRATAAVSDMPMLAQGESLGEPEVEAMRTSATTPGAGPIAVTLLPPLDSVEGSSRSSRSRPSSRASERTVSTPKSRPKPEPVEAAPTPESLLAQARTRLDAMASYQVRLTRQERLGAALPAAEDVIVSIRKNPRAVRLEWPDGPHKGRESIYVDGGPMYISLPHGLIPRMALDPNSPLVMRNSRHPITEAGFESILTTFAHDLADTASTKVRMAGTETPEGFARPCDKVVATFAGGETGVLDFDPTTHLPALVERRAADGSLLESYRFLDVQADPPTLASADAFNPDARWGPPHGLLSRLGADGGRVQR